MLSNFFSVLIPTRQRHDTLKYSIQSVINQTYKDFELVIMDNFSSSETAKVVASFDDSRIKYYRAPERLSMCDNWELGLSHTKGEYIFVLGDDDALMPDGLELGSKFIENYKVKIISWLRSYYGWPNAIVPWIRNRMGMNLMQIAEIYNSKERLKQFYQYQISHEYLPMIYNSLVHRDLINKIKSIHGRYFHTGVPDVYSGIVNAYFSDTYLYSIRALSITGSSGHSTGASSLYPTWNEKPLNDYLEDEKKDVRAEFHPCLIPTDTVVVPLTPEISIADVQLCTKKLFFSEADEYKIDMNKLLNLISSSLNRDTGTYEKTLQYIQALAQKHEIPMSSLNIPEKLLNAIELNQGLVQNSDGLVKEIIINCEQVGISNVAQAAMLAQGILPSLSAIRVLPVNIEEVEHQENFQDINKKRQQTVIPKIVLDGVFFQLYKTGIGRVWQSLLSEWVENGFAKHIVFIDRGGTAPKIPGVQYRQLPICDYENISADREMLQQICDAEAADLFISTYYTTPVSTPSVLMVYDMIPEVMEWDLDDPIWQAKHHSIRQATAYVAISENTVRDFTRFFSDIPIESLTVAPCGVQSTFFPAPIEEINSFKKKYGISNPYFMLVGRGGYKNTILFLQAFAQLYSRQGFEIVSTGSGPLLEDEFKAYPSDSVVNILQLSDQEMRAAYSGAVALVFPSTYEGFGLPILEAFACGCPVITCPNGSIPEVAGEAALYVNDDDVDGLTNALCEIQKPDVRKTLKAAGLEQAKKFSWSKMASTVTSVLINATLLPLKLKEINLIVFPDWSQPEESLGIELGRVISAIATHPDKNRMTLLIDTSNIADQEDANLLLSSIAMNLLMEEDIDVTEGPEISLVRQLGDIQWKALLPRIQARIVLENENSEAIAQAKAENLALSQIDSID